MFEVQVTLIDKEPGTVRVKIITTPLFGMWINRYPEGHQLAGEVRDIRLIVEEDGQETFYTTHHFTIKKVPK